MLRRVLTLAVVLFAAVAPAVPAQAQENGRHPIVFVHGFSGSGSQYETPARRFTSNGYPADWVTSYEYDSVAVATGTDPTVVPNLYAGLDARIDAIRARTGADRIDLVAHSLGTRLMQGYLLSSPERAARVAHYVNLDGATATAPPGGVPTLAVWGEGDPARTIAGAENVRFPDQGHTQTVTSVESFRAVYTFLNGRSPRTDRITPQRTVLLSGRAVLFPSNAGVDGATLEVYRVGALTGQRLDRRPIATFTLTGDGAFGPFRGRGDQRYEFAVVRPGAATHHLYYQPFRRTDQLIRLLTSRPGEGLGALTETSDATTNLVVNRQKEWWGDQGTAGDTLLVNGRSVLTPTNSPRTHRTIGLFAYDAGLDGVTDLAAPIPAFFSQPFISGADVSIPSRRAGCPLTVVLSRPRGGGGHIDNLTVPAWPSSTDRITLQFDDYTQR